MPTALDQLLDHMAGVLLHAHLPRSRTKLLDDLDEGLLVLSLLNAFLNNMTSILVKDAGFERGK